MQQGSLGNITTSYSGKLFAYADLKAGNVVMSKISDSTEIASFLNSATQEGADDWRDVYLEFVDFAKNFDAAKIAALNALGFIFTMYTELDPWGTTLPGEYLPESVITDVVNVEIVDAFIHIAYSPVGKDFTVTTVHPAAAPLTKDEVVSRGFAELNMNGMIVAVAQYTGSGYSWSDNRLVAGDKLQYPSLNVGVEYALSCFEGAVAMLADDGTPIIVEPEANARRIRKSCYVLGLPAPTEEQIVEAMQHFVRANQKYMVPGLKFYIRPTIWGIKGGVSVYTADLVLFRVDGFPFGDYAGGKDVVSEIVILPGAARSHSLVDPHTGKITATGAYKIAGNYGQTIESRRSAKMGMLHGFAGRKFADIAYAAEIDGEAYLDENSSSNLIFLKDLGGNKVQLLAPDPRLRDAVLDSNTRKTVLELAGGLSSIAGYEDYPEIEIITGRDLKIKDLADMDGAASVGSAAGLGRVGTIVYGYPGSKEYQEFIFDAQGSVDFESTPVGRVLFGLYDVLYDLRQGRTTGLPGLDELICRVE